MADPSKVEAILKMEPPMDVTGSKKFGGMVNYLGILLSNLLDEMEPLRQLTHQNAEWEWTDEHDRAFNRIETNF